jgi:hypothetical protein
VFNFVNFTNFKDLLQFSQEQCFFDTVGKWPVLEETFEKSDGKCSILGQEKHRASQELFVELGACLYLMKRDDNIFEEYNVLISKWDGKSTNDACQDIQEFCRTIEFVSFMN